MSLPLSIADYIKKGQNGFCKMSRDRRKETNVLLRKISILKNVIRKIVKLSNTREKARL